MGRTGIKFLTDFGPLLVFFVMYFRNDQNLKIAIPPFVIATLIPLLPSGSFFTTYTASIFWINYGLLFYKNNN